MKKQWIGIWILLAFALSGGAQAQTDPALAPDREPELRQIDKVTDAPASKRLEVVRARLPVEYRKRNNFAWAVAKIDGLDKVEFYAHSGIQDLETMSSVDGGKIQDISLRPAAEQAKFKTLCVNQNGAVEGGDCWQRDVDTEYKILEDVASRIPDPSAAGRVRLYTELYPCPSCWNVMKQFLTTYTNVQLQVLYQLP